MLSYIVRRVLWAVVLFLVLSLVTYIIFFVIPTDSVRTTAGKSVDFRDTTGLHGGVVQEYTQFLHRLVTHGSMGKSFFGDRRTVNETIAEAAPVTISLVVGGAILWMLIAIPLGVYSALRPRSLLDRVGMIFVLIGVSAHPVWIGLLLGFVFGFKLHVLPLTNYCDFFSPPTAAQCGGPMEWARHLILPWVTFAILFAAFYARMIRASVLEALDEEYVRTARAKGASEWHVIKRHVLRNAMLPVVTMLGMDVGRALAGALFVETVFGLPGIGKVLFAALQRHDLPIIEGVVVFTTLAIILLNLVVDLLYAFFDPRVKYG